MLRRWLTLWYRAASSRSSRCICATGRDLAEIQYVDERRLGTNVVPQLDTDSGLQHEASTEGPCDLEVVCRHPHPCHVFETGDEGLFRVRTANSAAAGTWVANLGFDQCGSDTVEE